MQFIKIITASSAYIQNHLAWTKRSAIPPNMIQKLCLLLVFFFVSAAHADVVSVVDESGKSIASVMVTQSLTSALASDTSDNGYPTPGKPLTIGQDITQFTDASGKTTFDDDRGSVTYRFRKPGYKDVSIKSSNTSVQAMLLKELDPLKFAESKSANAWASSMKLSPERATHFRMQCAFCHQQGNAFTRTDKSPKEWQATIDRMIVYGSRLPGSLKAPLAEELSVAYKHLREQPSLVAADTPWPTDLSHSRITEWPIGTSMSLAHDLVIGQNGLIYIGDTVQDRLYEVNTISNEVTTYRIPHRASDKSGGLMSAGLETFPKHESTSQPHSLALSKVDGHIFITPTNQRRLIEFNPRTKQFSLHEMEQGFHPHTVRIDAKDRVWFTLALSSQIAMFDRKTKSFTYYDLPTRSLWEKIQVSLIPLSFKLMDWGIPMSKWFSADEKSTGVPFPYGIDITPNGRVWFARLYSQEIGVIDPDTGTVTIIPTPFIGPRRLRADLDGNIWIASFGSSLIAKYVPEIGKFFTYDLPVIPKGSETPYVLNIDNKNGIVWVAGNQSDLTYGFHMKSESWSIIPMPKKTTFVREFDFDDAGTVYTINSNFPAWHIEGGLQSLIRIEKR